MNKEKIKQYIKPEYANYSNDKLMIEITKNFDDIKYIMRKTLDITLLNRKQLEELHGIMRTLHYVVFDLENL